MKSVRSKTKEKLKTFQKPMLATLGDQPFNDPDWVFEIKWDGYRAIADVNKKTIQLYSRNGLSFKSLYPPIADALQKLNINAVLDGEIVVFNDSNKPDFQRLQQFGELKKGKLVYFVFDCLYLNGKSIMNKPLLERKKILKKLLPKSSTIKYATHVKENGINFFAGVKNSDLEGMIAKHSPSVYKSGKRSTDWLKIKNHNTQEAIIAGYTTPRKSRKYFGALILAIRQKNKLKYIGHAGTGFTNATLKNVYEKLQPYIQTESPFSTKVPVNTTVTWVDPRLVCNIKFSEVTQGGILRHAVFMGIRVDKSANEVNTIDVPSSTKNTTKNSGRRPVRERSLKTKKVTETKT